MIWIGIDPGKKGGYAAISDYGIATTQPWDDEQFVKDMRMLSKSKCIAAVEKVGAMPGQGVTSMFTFGQSFGFILGVLAALEIPFQLVPPREWKKAFGLNSDKAKSIEVAHRLFPEVPLKRTERCKVDSDGLAESLLLAEWGRRNL